MTNFHTLSAKTIKKKREEYLRMGNPKKQSSSSNNQEELHSAARSGDLNAVLTICSTNPLAINFRDKHSRTPLHLAAWSGHAQVVDYLCKNKADVGAAAIDDMGAIHFASQKGHLEVVRLLLSSGVSAKSCNRKGMTALHYAAQGSHLELVKYLVKKGANINTKNKAGKTPIDLASNEEVSSFLRESKNASSKEDIDSGEKVLGSELKSPSLEKVECSDGKTAAMEEGEVERQETVKRKGDEDETKENSKETKKAKVSLNHLLASDDTQEDDENF